MTSDAVNVSKPGGVSGELIDHLAETAVFGADPEIAGTARWVIRSLAAAAGIRPASIHDLYMAMGRGEVAGFTVPAINIRAMAYDTARAAVRAAERLTPARSSSRSPAPRSATPSSARTSTPP